MIIELLKNKTNMNVNNTINLTSLEQITGMNNHKIDFDSEENSFEFDGADFDFEV